MNIDPHTQEIAIKLLIALALGLIIGAEREYRNKSAGLRTMILICLGSAVFTIISMEISHPTEVGRIASNIVTGIGFLGAGAIMRDGMTVQGLTTASTIWIVASIGMAVGVGETMLAVLATLCSMVVLVLFNSFESMFDRIQKVIILHIVFRIEENGIQEVESHMKSLHLKYRRLKEGRREGDVKYEYELRGNDTKVKALVDYLTDQKEKVKSFEY
jgi:putative Mg2+ transporter-C (MgtC) family protein